MGSEKSLNICNFLIVVFWGIHQNIAQVKKGAATVGLKKIGGIAILWKIPVRTVSYIMRGLIPNLTVNTRRVIIVVLYMKLS